MKKSILILFMTLSVFLFLALPARADRLTVVASVFPLFDFAREIAGNEADVRMLLPAGVEPHSWEPKPSDIVAVSRADIFLYVNEAMEPWAHNLVTAVSDNGLSITAITDNLGFDSGKYRHDHEEHMEKETGSGSDPHFWLDLDLSARAVQYIGTLFAKEDPVHADGYTGRAQIYASRIKELDRAFSRGLGNCRTRKFVTGGHSAFGHLANRYGLEQISLYGISPDSEPTPAHLASVTTTMRRENLDVVFFEEMVNPRIARVLASETGAVTMVLNPAGNLTADRMNQGTTFFQIMEENLNNLRKGLYCE